MQEKNTITGVDCHAHVVATGLPLAPEIHSNPARDASAEQFLDIMHAHGVSHGVLTAPSFYGSNNTLLLEALRRHPKHLRGTVMVDPGLALSELRQQLVQMREAGVVGIRFNWIKKKNIPDISSAQYQRVLGLAKELGMHIELFLEDALQDIVVPKILASGAVLVLDHFGNPDPSKGIHSAAFQNTLRGLSDGKVWVKLSGPYRLGGGDIQPYLNALLAANPRQLVWASDWPWISYENQFQYADCVDWIKSGIDIPQIWEDIFIHNPKSLFHF